MEKTMEKNAIDSYIKEYIREFNENRKNPLPPFYVGLLYMEANDFGSATNWFSAATEVDKKFAPAYFFSGLVRLLTSKFDMALLDWELYMRYSGSLFQQGFEIPFPFDLDGYINKIVTRCTQRLNLLPEEESSLSLMALASVFSKNLPQAVKYLQQAVDSGSASKKIYVLLIELYMNMGEIDRAVELLRELARQEPDSFSVNYKLAQLYMQINNYSRAIACFKKSFMLKPTRPRILAELAKAYRLSEKYELSYETLADALTLDEKLFEAWFELGLLAEKQFKYSSAIRFFEKTLLLKPGHAGSYFHLGSIFKAQGRNDEAMAVFDAYLAAHPDSFSAHYQLGEVFALEGMHEDASLEFIRCTVLDPNDVYSYFNLGKSLSLCAYEKEAVAAFGKVLELKPDCTDAYYYTGFTYLKMGEPNKARRELERFVSLKPNDTYGRFALGNAYLSLDEHHLAAKEYRKAVELYPDHPYARFNLAASYACAGEYDAAQREFARAFRQRPPETEDEMILFATLGSYQTIFHELTRAVNDIQTYFSLYEEANNRYKVEEKVKQRIAGLFKKFLPEKVADELLEQQDDMEARQCRVTALFTDIRGYTKIAEQSGSTAAMQFLNEYYGLAAEIIRKYDGTLLYFQGDAQMVIFGAPSEDPEHAFNALKTIQSIKKLAANLNAERFGAGVDHIEIAAGISTGDVLMGFINDGMRLQYTAIGDTVNVAARLQDLSKEHNSSIILSEATYDEVKEHVQAVRMEDVHLKGKSEPVNVYRVLY